MIVAELPRDLRMRIAKLVICDMDTRIALGIVGRLRVPQSVRATLSIIARPAVLGEDAYGVRIDRHVIFRGIVDSSNDAFCANCCECHDFVEETGVGGGGSRRRMLVERCGVYPVSDFWPIFPDIAM